MSDKIYAVQGDQLPQVTLTITDLDDNVATIVGCTGVEAHMRRVGGSDTVTIPATADTVASTVTFNFSNGELAEAGDYEIEVELDFAGLKHTLYRPLRMRVRPQFA